MNCKILWADKISKTVPENLSPEDSYLLRAGILAEFGKIVCISTGYFYEDANKNVCFKVKSICCDDEKEILQNFLQITNSFHKPNNRFQFAGHNIREFDIPYICRRLLINNIPLAFLPADSWRQTLGNRNGRYVAVVEVWRL